MGKNIKKRIRKFILIKLLSFEWGYYFVREYFIKWGYRQNLSYDDITEGLIALRKMYLKINKKWVTN